jgi:hypothetical protein
MHLSYLFDSRHIVIITISNQERSGNHPSIHPLFVLFYSFIIVHYPFIALKAMTNPSAANAPGSSQVFLSTSDLARIRTLSSPPQRPSASASGHHYVPTDEEAREYLHQKSLARTSKWTNTIEGQRLAQLQAREARAAEREAKMQILDAHEEALREQARQTVLQRAREAQLLKSDAVRALKSRILLAEVTEDRKVQIAQKEATRNSMQQDAAAYHSYLESTWQQWDTKTEDARLAKISATESLKRAQEEQRRELEAKRMMEQKARDEEGERIKQAALDALEAERVKMAERRAAQQAQLRATRDANAQLQVLRKEEEKRREEEEAKIAAYASKKERDMALRKQREDERFAAQLARRQQLIDAQAAALAAMKSSEEARLEGQVKEAEAKAEEKSRNEQAAKEALKQAVDASRQQQLAQKRRKDAVEQQRKQVAQMQMRELAQMLGEEDAIEDEAKLRRARAVAGFQRKQAAEKKLKEEELRLRESIEAQQRLAKHSGANSREEKKMLEEYLRLVAQRVGTEQVDAVAESTPVKRMLAQTGATWQPSSS